MVSGYSTSLLLFAMFASIDVRQAKELTKAPPILWQKIATKVVSEPVDFLVEIAYCNPCTPLKLVEQYQVDEHELEMRACEEKYDRLHWIIEHLVSLAPQERGWKESKDVSCIMHISDFHRTLHKDGWDSTQLDPDDIWTYETNFDNQRAGICNDNSDLLQFVAQNRYKDGFKNKLTERMRAVERNLNSTTKLLSNLALPIARRQLNLTVLSEIVSYSFSSGLEDPILLSVSSRSMGHLQLRFSAKRRASGAHVYRVRAFTYWQNLLNIPELMDYTGPPYLLYNSTSNCAKSLNSTVKDSKILVDRCTHPNSASMQLSNWTGRATDGIGLPTSYLLANDSTLVYCFSNNITIDGREQECPPWVIKLANTSTWRTSDNLTVSSTSDAILEPPRALKIHFAGDPYINDYLKSIKQNFVWRTQQHDTQSDSNFVGNVVIPLSIFVNVFVLLVYLCRNYIRKYGLLLVGQGGNGSNVSYSAEREGGTVKMLLR